MKFSFLPRIRRRNTNTQEKFLLGAILRERYGKEVRAEFFGICFVARKVAA